MLKALVKDELWAVVEPLLPKGLPKPGGGRPRIDNRAVTYRYPVRAQEDGHLLVDAPAGEGLWLGYELLALPGGAARGRRVITLAPSPRGPPGIGRAY